MKGPKWSKRAEQCGAFVPITVSLSSDELTCTVHAKPLGLPSAALTAWSAVFYLGLCCFAFTDCTSASKAQTGLKTRLVVCSQDKHVQFVWMKTYKRKHFQNTPDTRRVIRRQILMFPLAPSVLFHILVCFRKPSQIKSTKVNAREGGLCLILLSVTCQLEMEAGIVGK